MPRSSNIIVQLTKTENLVECHENDEDFVTLAHNLGIRRSMAYSLVRLNMNSEGRTLTEAVDESLIASEGRTLTEAVDESLIASEGRTLTEAVDESLIASNQRRESVRRLRSCQPYLLR